MQTILALDAGLRSFALLESKGSKLQWHVFLQVAQAVSTRVDILSPEYLIEIERLQDDVAPFPTVQVHTSLR